MVLESSIHLKANNKCYKPVNEKQETIIYKIVWTQLVLAERDRWTKVM